MVAIRHPTGGWRIAGREELEEEQMRSNVRTGAADDGTKEAELLDGKNPAEADPYFGILRNAKGESELDRSSLSISFEFLLASEWMPLCCGVVPSTRGRRWTSKQAERRGRSRVALVSIQLLLFLFASRLCFTVVVNRPDRPDLLLENYGKTCMPLTSLPSSSSSYFGAGP